MTNFATDILRQHAANAANNAPLHEQQGDVAQAALDRAVAQDCERAAELQSIVDEAIVKGTELAAMIGGDGR